MIKSSPQILIYSLNMLKIYYWNKQYRLLTYYKTIKFTLTGPFTLDSKSFSNQSGLYWTAPGHCDDMTPGHGQCWHLLLTKHQLPSSNVVVSQSCNTICRQIFLRSFYIIRFLCGSCYLLFIINIDMNQVHVF